MKAMCTAAMVLGLCNLTSARDEKADPVGTWMCEYEIGGQKRESTLVVKKDGDKLVGTMTYQDKQESKLKEVKLKDGDLSFTAEREVMEMKLTIKYKLKVEGDKLKGKAGVEVGGETREFDFEGTRAKKDK
jgi:hypothetical protein